jgi:hypothetical protein
MVTAKVRGEIATIHEHEAITAYRSQQATEIQYKQQMAHMQQVSNISSAAALNPTNYSMVMLNPETRKLLPEGLTGDYATDKPMLDTIARAGQDSIKAADLARKQADSAVAAVRAKAAAAASSASADASKARARLTQQVYLDTVKNGGEKSLEAKDAKASATDARRAALTAKDRKEFPPAPLDPASRITGQAYTAADGKTRFIWEKDPTDGKLKGRVLAGASPPSRLANSLVNANEPAGADVVTADDTGE